MSFQQGLSGLGASSKALDSVGNNIANSGTVGFKSATTAFADVFAATMGSGSQIGIGTAIASINQQFTQGNITVTNNPLDLAINGQGFFRLENSAGAETFTRNGQFSISNDGYIVNANGLRLTGYQPTTAGNPSSIFVDTSNLQPQATGTGPTGAGLEIGLNLDSRNSIIPAATPFDINDPSSYNSSSSATVYDSLGNPHLLTMYFRKLTPSAPNQSEWDVYTSLNGGAAVSVNAGADLVFNTSGALITPADGVLPQSFAVATGATSPLDFNLDLTGSTQYGNNFGVNSIRQDGYTSGQLAGLSVAANGTIQGRYTNGQSRDLAVVSLTNFNNPNGLTSLGNNQWAQTPESGQAMTGRPATSSLGVIQSAAVEESNVDLTAELVNMITYQRAYQANAQTIKTQDSIMQTLVNLR